MRLPSSQFLIGWGKVIANTLSVANSVQSWNWHGVLDVVICFITSASALYQATPVDGSPQADDDPKGQ